MSAQDSRETLDSYVFCLTSLVAAVQCEMQWALPTAVRSRLSKKKRKLLSRADRLRKQIQVMAEELDEAVYDLDRELRK